MKRMKKRKGFTIVELVIVIAVIAILATTLMPTFGNVIQNAKDSAAKQEAKNAFTSYMIEHPELSGSLFIYQTDGRYVAIKNGAPVGIYDTQAEACKALGLAEDAQFSDTGVDKLLISGDAPTTPSEPSDPTVPQKESLAGKKISFMGDSISTFKGWSNNTNYSTTLKNYPVYFGETVSPSQLSVDNTWWKKTVDKLGLELCVNNSYSGSRVTIGGNKAGSEGNSARSENLHNDNTGMIPDIIVIYMGTNDYQDNVEVSTFATNYDEMVGRIKAKYPEADIYLCTLLHYDKTTAGKTNEPALYNEKIESVAAKYGCNVVDFYNGTGVAPENLKDYTVDLLINSGDISLVHPNAAGMSKMYECLKMALSNNYTIEEAEEESYSVTVNKSEKDKYTTVGEYSSAIAEGAAFELTLSKYLKEVTVTMGGDKVDCYDHLSGKVTIPYVTGDVVITVQVAKWMECFNELPENISNTTDLCDFTKINTIQGFYYETATNGWDGRGTVRSAAFPVSEGMTISSSSFEHIDGSNKGTYMAWIMKDGSIKFVTGPELYAEQENNGGYVTVPKGAVAICMAWRTNCTAEDACGNNYMYIDIPEWLQYVNELPNDFNSETNLYELEGLITRDGFYYQDKWQPREDVKSAIFPVSTGMRITSESLKHTTNSKGTYIAWLMEDGSVRIVTGDQVYEEQAANNGYITAPEGAVAISMVWRNNCTCCTSHYMYIDMPSQN